MYASAVEHLLQSDSVMNAKLKPDLPRVVVAHSLGGSIALELLHRAAHGDNQLNSLFQSQCQAGVFLSSVGLTPHKGIRPYSLIRAMGAMAEIPILGDAVVGPLLRELYVRVLGFSPRLQAREAAVAQRRVCGVDFPSHEEMAHAIRSSPLFPDGSLQCVFALDDHLMEMEVLQGMTSALGAQGTVLPDGGHHAPVRAAHAQVTADAIVRAIDAVKRT